MSGLIFGGIAPHGSSVIGEIAGDEYELFRPIREGMEIFGQRFKRKFHSLSGTYLFWNDGCKL